MAAVVKNREEDAERLAEEVTESRDDLNRMLDAFRHRERQLLDDIETLQHKNVTLSDLVDLVTERAESTQKELDRCRAGDVTNDVTALAPSTDVTLQKEWEVNKFRFLPITYNHSPRPLKIIWPDRFYRQLSIKCCLKNGKCDKNVCL